MLSKPRDPFISLVDKNEATMPAEAKVGMSPRGPMLYISDVPLPIVDDDLNQTLTAEIKVKVERITSKIENGKTSKSYDFEVKGIRFK